MLALTAHSGVTLTPEVDVDTRTPEQRRRIMQAVKSKNTTPELSVRRLLHRMGYRYRLHREDLPGKPDIAFLSRRRAIFVHGCFWHGHGCRRGRPPKSRPDYWLPKLRANIARDRAKVEQLEVIGWRVLTVWQCELSDLDTLTARIRRFLDESKARATMVTASFSGGQRHNEYVRQ